MAEENQVAEQQTQSEPVEQTTVNWRDSLPEDLKEDPSLKTIQDIPGLAKSYIHSQKMVGKDKIVLPNEHATKEDWDDVFNKLGRPASAEEYKIEGEASELINNFKPVAHTLGLNNTQVQELVNFYNQAQEQAGNDLLIDAEAHRAEAEAALRKEFGRAFQNKVGSAMRLAQTVFTKEQLDNTKLADGSTLGNNVDLIKGFAKLADQLGEDRPLPNPQANILTPDAAREKIATYMEPGSPYWNKSHPNHQKAIDDVLNLREIANDTEG
jgi:hypothetical protein